MADSAPKSPAGERRSFLSVLSTFFMAAGLIGGYGLFASIAGRFMFPARGSNRSWLFVTDLKRMKPGDSIIYRSPTGAPVAVARQGRAGTVDDFIALSSTCPHLGCQVHWEGPKNRFFCPCHNGIFDADGKGTGGPPAQAGQSLARYPLKVENGLLFIEVEMKGLTARVDTLDRGAPAGPGHDPCLHRAAGRNV